MRKSKILKALLVFGMSIATATSVVGMTACGHEHVDENKDGKCDVCATEMETEGGNQGETPGGETPGGTTPGGTTPGGTTPGGETPGGETPGGEIVNPKIGKWIVSNDATDEYTAGATISDNDLYTLKAETEARYYAGAAGKSSLEGEYIIEGLSSEAIHKGVMSGPSDNGDIKAGEYVNAVYSITAKENASLIIYLNFVNMSYNSDRAKAQITYTLGSDAAVYVESVARAGVAKLEVTVPKNQTLSIGVNNTIGNTGRLWLFGVDGIETKDTVTVNYNYGDKLIASQIVEESATIAAPSDAVMQDAKFLGWYTAATGGSEYNFGALSSGVTSVDVYAQFKTSDVTINYHKEDPDSAGQWIIDKTVKAYSGAGVDEYKLADKADGSAFLGWTETANGTTVTFNHETNLSAGTIELYPVFEATVVGTIVVTTHFSGTNLAIGNAETVLVGTGAVSDAATVTTLKDGEAASDVVATVTLAASMVGGKKSTTIVANGVSTSNQIQTNADNGKIFDLNLVSGYKYKVQIWARTNTSGTASKFQLADASSNIGDAKATGTGNTNSDFVEISWDNLAAGNYSISQVAKKSVIALIVITATPVA